MFSLYGRKLESEFCWDKILKCKSRWLNVENIVFTVLLPIMTFKNNLNFGTFHTLLWGSESVISAKWKEGFVVLMRSKTKLLLSITTIPTFGIPVQGFKNNSLVLFLNPKRAFSQSPAAKLLSLYNDYFLFSYFISNSVNIEFNNGMV